MGSRSGLRKTEGDWTLSGVRGSGGVVQNTNRIEPALRVGSRERRNTKRRHLGRASVGSATSLRLPGQKCQQSRTFQALIGRLEQCPSNELDFGPMPWLSEERHDFAPLTLDLNINRLSDSWEVPADIRTSPYLVVHTESGPSSP